MTILYLLFSFIVSFWWVFAIIFGLMFLASIFSSKSKDTEALLAENNRLLGELIKEQKKNRKNR